MKGTPLDLAAVLRYLDARLATQPEYADLRNLRGLARAHAGDIAGARGDLSHALRVNVDYAAARYDLAWLEARRGEREAADAVLGASAPAAWRRRLEIVQAVRSAGVEAALALVPADSGAAGDALDRLWLLVEAARWDDAEAQLAALAGRDPDLHALLHTAGLLRAGRAQPAVLRAWATAYAGNPHVGALFQVGAEVALAAGDADTHARALAWSCALSFDLCSYWVALGTHHDRRGEERAALVALRRAVLVDPERVEARVALGYLLAARGESAAAIVEMETAARLAPGWVDVRYQLGLLYASAARAEAAEAELRAALAQNDGYVPAQLALGSLLQEQGRDTEALRLLQRARQTGLRSADLEARLASLHERLGHHLQARRALLRARARGRGAVD